MTTAPYYSGGFGAFGGTASVFTGGCFPEDPRSPVTSPTSQAMTGILFPSPMITISAAPSALSATNLATSVSGTAATPLVLVAGTGITLVGSNYYIDGAPATNASSNNALTLQRAIRIVSAGNDSGITFAIVGTDIYGVTVHQTLTGANAGTATTAKTFKSIVSVTPSGNTASTVTVGTTDVYGLPLAATGFGQIQVNWNNALITANTGFTAAVATTASGTTGDVRGTYALQTTASNGTLVLNVLQFPASFTSVSALYGVAQF